MSKQNPNAAARNFWLGLASACGLATCGASLFFSLPVPITIGAGVSCAAVVFLAGCFCVAAGNADRAAERQRRE